MNTMNSSSENRETYPQSLDEEGILKLAEESLGAPINEYKFYRSGNIVVEVNNEWIFRFSRSKDREIKQLLVEKEFLRTFEKVSPIKVPKIEFEWDHYAGFGYKKFIGEPLDPKILAQLPTEKRKEICRQLGEFLTQLHSMQWSHEDLLQYPLGDSDFWNDVWKSVEPHLSQELKRKAFDYFTEYFQKEPGYTIEKTICNADFHYNHILFDTTTNTISGIIDFGRLSLNDPAIDFNILQRFYGPDIIRDILKNYNVSIADNFHERIEFQKMRRLFAAIYFAKIYGPEDRILYYLGRIEESFSEDSEKG